MVNFSIFDSATSELFHAISILVELRLYYGKFETFFENGSWKWAVLWGKWLVTFLKSAVLSGKR